MKIIAHKTSFYLTDDFFKNIITADYVDGVILDIVLNVDNKILVYNYDSSFEYSVKQFQNTPLNKIIGSSVLTLEEALELIYENRKTIPIFLNLVPNTLDISSEEDLLALNKRNREYLFELNNVLKKYTNMDISLHSINRNLVLLIQKEFLKHKTGFVIYVSDLTPTEVDYYIFPTYMINDVIFKEILDNNRRIMIYAENESDLATITEKYASSKTTDFSKSILNDLSFISNQPILLNKIFK